MQGKPIWISNRMETYFKNKVLLPFTNPSLYHAEFVPIPFCQAIVGRKGVDKLRTIEHLVRQANIYSTRTVDVQFGKTTDALADISAFFKSCNEQNDKDQYGPRDLLIVNHADILCFEPDNEHTLMEATKIAEAARSCNVLVIALCDRAVGTGGDMSQNMTVWAKTCQRNFFTQFDVVTFASAPDAAFRIKFMQWAIEEFAKHLQLKGRKLIVELSEKDYKVIEDYTTYATQDHLMDWLQRVNTGLIEDGCRIILDLDFMSEFLGKRMGVHHVCDFDARAVEDMYSSASGAGPIAPLSSSSSIRRFGEEEEQKKAHPPAGGMFTEDNADIEHAVHELHPDDDEPVELERRPKRERHCEATVPTENAFGIDEFASLPPEAGKEEEKKKNSRSSTRRKRTKK